MNPPKPDYAFWNTIDPIEIQRVAWLWCDLEPPSGAFKIGGDEYWPGKVLSSERMLLQECRQRHAALARGHHLRHMNEPTATRSQLRVIAERLGLTPPFLFPELRPTETLHESERATLLKIIGALLELQGIEESKKPDSAYRSEADQLLKTLSRHKIAEPCEGKTLAKHIKNAFDFR